MKFKIALALFLTVLIFYCVGLLSSSLLPKQPVIPITVVETFIIVKNEITDLTIKHFNDIVGGRVLWL
ncbi:MAG: hypothetical protein ACRCX2_14710 [Paraclostridium sp.]